MKGSDPPPGASCIYSPTKLKLLYCQLEQENKCPIKETNQLALTLGGFETPFWLHSSVSNERVHEMMKITLKSEKCYLTWLLAFWLFYVGIGL